MEKLIKRKSDVKKIIEKIKKGCTFEYGFTSVYWGYCYARISYKDDGEFSLYWYNLKGNESIKPGTLDEERLEKMLWQDRKHINTNHVFYV